MMDDGRDTPTGRTPNSDTNGYVKSSSKYFVTDNLEIFPSSNSLALLKKLKVENMSSLDSIELRVGTDEVMNRPIKLFGYGRCHCSEGREPIHVGDPNYITRT